MSVLVLLAACSSAEPLGNARRTSTSESSPGGSTTSWNTASTVDGSTTSHPNVGPGAATTAPTLTTRPRTTTTGPVSPGAGCGSAPSRTRRLGVADGPSVLDVFPTPVRCPAPVVILVHGGGYCCGDKSQVNQSVIDWLNAQGYAVVNTDYRLGVMYPAFDDDVASAIAWVARNAGTFGGDGTRIALFGHSTGGEMVAETATTPAVLASAGLSIHSVRCVGLLDPSALDVETMLRNPPSPATLQTYQHAYGTNPAVWHSASAITNARNGTLGASFLIAERGNFAAVQLRYAAIVRSHGLAVTVIDANALNHGQVINDIGAPGDHVMTSPVLSFLRSCAG